MTKLCLLWQILVTTSFVMKLCHDKHIFVTTKVLSWLAYFCRERCVLLWQKWYLWQLQPLIFMRMYLWWSLCIFTRMPGELLQVIQVSAALSLLWKTVVWVKACVPLSVPHAHRMSGQFCYTLLMPETVSCTQILCIQRLSSLGSSSTKSTGTCSVIWKIQWVPNPQGYVALFERYIQLWEDFPDLSD